MLLPTDPQPISVAEQTTGVIVGCMPVLPALFRYLSQQLSQLRSSGASGGWRFGRGSSSLLIRGSKSSSSSSPPRANDPYFLGTKESDAATDLESARGRPLDFNGTTTTTIKGGASDSSLSEKTAAVPPDADDQQSLHHPNRAIVSKSIQVESHPRTASLSTTATPHTTATPTAPGDASSKILAPPRPAFAVMRRVSSNIKRLSSTVGA